MSATESIQLLLLDDDWRPVGRINGHPDWRQFVQELLLLDSQWLLVEQQRLYEYYPYPCWDDIRLSRAIARRLRPLEVKLADHVIQGSGNQFSFRAAGLL